MASDGKYGAVTVGNDSERNPLNGTDEPVIVFRAQDALVVPLLARYRNMKSQAVSENGEPYPIEWFTSLDERIDEVRAWQEANRDRVKLPD